MPIIETPRLLLRPFRKEDAADVFAYLENPEMHCFLDMRLPSLAAAEAEMERRAAEELYLAVELKETGRVIGEFFAHAEGTDPAAEVKDTWSPCWMLRPDCKGQGYGFEAAKAFLDYLFRECSARRVYMYTEEYNTACRKLCEKLGARQEGCFVEFVSFVNDEAGNPIYETTLQYAILRKEWQF